MTGNLYGLPPSLLAAKDGNVVRLTLNRPDAANAVDGELHEALADVWTRIAADDDVRAVILTGAGRAFCAGGDATLLRDIREDPHIRRASLAEGARIVREMVAFPLPVIAAVNGAAIGLGCSLAVLCDIVLLSDRARLADPHVAVGVVAADGGAAVWPVLTSMVRAKEYLFTGDRIAPEEAVSLGLATRVVPADDLLATATALAQRLADLPRQALQDTKRAINMHLERAITGILEFGFAAESTSFTSPEHHEIMRDLFGESAG